MKDNDNENKDAAINEWKKTYKLRVTVSELMLGSKVRFITKGAQTAMAPELKLSPKHDNKEFWEKHKNVQASDSPPHDDGSNQKRRYTVSNIGTAKLWDYNNLLVWWVKTGADNNWHLAEVDKAVLPQTIPEITGQKVSL
jgi:hypothetical protein